MVTKGLACICLLELHTSSLSLHTDCAINIFLEGCPLNLFAVCLFSSLLLPYFVITGALQPLSAGPSACGRARIRWGASAAQKIKKLSETPATVPIVAKLCMFDSKNRKIAEKLVQPVTPHLGCFQWGLQWRNS